MNTELAELIQYIKDSKDETVREAVFSYFDGIKFSVLKSEFDSMTMDEKEALILALIEHLKR